MAASPSWQTCTTPSVIGTSTPCPAGQLQHRAAGLARPPRPAADRGPGLLQRLAPAQPLAERTVAGQRRAAGRDQVAEPGQPGERHRVGAERGAQPGGLGQPAGDQRGPGVVAEAHPLGHPAGQRDHVLHRAAELAADHVGVGVRAEVRREARLLQQLGPALRRCRRRPSRSAAPRRSRGPGSAPTRPRPARRRAGHLADDLAHPLGRAELDALHQADQGGVPGEQPAPSRPGSPAASAPASRAPRSRAPASAAAGVGGGPQAGRQGDAGQVVGFSCRSADRGDQLRAAADERDLAAGVGEHLRERRPPGAGAEHGGPHQARLARRRPAEERLRRRSRRATRPAGRRTAPMIRSVTSRSSSRGQRLPPVRREVDRRPGHAPGLVPRERPDLCGAPRRAPAAGPTARPGSTGTSVRQRQPGGARSAPASASSPGPG